MDVLGIGSNMVKPLRYWLQTVGLTSEPHTGRRIQNFMELGHTIYTHDRYIEELGTLFLLQYKLASNKEDATAWYYFFNEFNMAEFTKEDFVASLQNYVLMNGDNVSVAMRSLNDDFTCIINTYLPRHRSNTSKSNPENNIDSPFGDWALSTPLTRLRKLIKKAFLLSHPSIPGWHLQ